MNINYLQKKKLPDAPGVYFFLGKNKKILYIGKATSLKDRVKSYFSKDLLVSRSSLIVSMVSDSKTLDFKETSSVLEALLLEADLIRKFKPDFNTKEKDDKSFNCVVITDEDFPQILIIRKKEIDFVELKIENFKLRSVFGPFPNGSQLKEALKIVRKIFPYRDEKCHIPNLSLKTYHLVTSSRPCFNYSIGLCPGTCVGVVEKKTYGKTIKQIELFLSGNLKNLKKNLEKDMKEFAKNHDFENAKKMRDKIFALNHINDISLIKSDNLSLITLNSSPSYRIESYDISHMSGQNMVGVMTVVINGEAQKNEYRKFNINTCENSNDPKAIKEVLERRFNHAEWNFPDFIVVDGNAIQINTANDVILKLGLKIPVVSVVKNEKHKAKGFLGREDLIKKYKKEILLANSEAHRFAIAFHKKKRSKNFLI